MKRIVFLLHGLAANPLLMWPMARKLRSEGYETINWGYRSTLKSCRHHALKLVEQVRAVAKRDDVETIHFVGHSMGCIVIRTALELYCPPQMGRVVMLSPPNQGSHAARWIGPGVRWLCPTMVELSHSPDSFVNHLPAPSSYKFGIIAAKFDAVIHQPRTHLPGEKDFAIVTCNHGLLPLHREAYRLTSNFLKTEFFEE